MDLRKSRTLMWIGFAIGLFTGLLGIASDNENITNACMVAGMIIVLLSVFQGWIFYKCPHCGESLMNIRGKIPNYCPKCGGILLDGETGEN